MSFNQEPFRIVPQGPPQAYQTYQMLRPLDEPRRKFNFWRKGTCEEFECDAFMHGWLTTIPDITDPFGKQQYDYLVADAERHFTHTVTANVAEFIYPPGNRCFQSANHMVPVERWPIFKVVGGDWRGNPRGEERVHTRGEHWVEDMALTLDAIRKRVEG